MDMAAALTELGSPRPASTRRPGTGSTATAQNRSDRPRRALHSCFARRSRGQQLDQKKYIRPGTLARLSPAARFILDV